jgi:hypothetical protein
MSDRDTPKVVSVTVPLYFYFLIGRQRPTHAQWRRIAPVLAYGGPLDGMTLNLTNAVDLDKSDLTALGSVVVWAGHPYGDAIRRACKQLSKRYPALCVDVVRARVELVGPTVKWPELVTVRVVA